MNVLVVEDNIVNQSILRRQLEAQGCQVEVASNGVEALELMFAEGESPFTVVLMDMEMPVGLTDGVDGCVVNSTAYAPLSQVMDGVATTERIRAIERQVESITRRTPIIGTSANARREQIDQMLLAGMVGER